MRRGPAHKTQAQLDAALANVKAEYERKVRDYMSSRGFKILAGRTVEVDVPLLVRRNTGLVRPLALAFDELANARSPRSAGSRCSNRPAPFDSPSEIR